MEKKKKKNQRGEKEKKKIIIITSRQFDSPCLIIHTESKALDQLGT